MFVPTLDTYMSPVMGWIGSPKPVEQMGILDYLRSIKVVQAFTIFTLGAMECFVSSMQFLLLIGPATVKETLELLRLKQLSRGLPDIKLGPVSVLAHKATALAVQALVGCLLVFWDPRQSVRLYDFLGLTGRVNRNRFLDYPAHARILYKQLTGAMGRVPSRRLVTPLASITLLSGLGLATRSMMMTTPVVPDGKVEVPLASDGSQGTIPVMTETNVIADVVDAQEPGSTVFETSTLSRSPDLENNDSLLVPHQLDVEGFYNVSKDMLKQIRNEYSLTTQDHNAATLQTSCQWAMMVAAVIWVYKTLA